MILEQARSPELQGGGDVLVYGAFGTIENAPFVLSNIRTLAPSASPSHRQTIYLMTGTGAIPVIAFPNLFARGDDVLHEPFPHIAHCRQPEADRAVAHGEVALGLVHVGHEHRDADLPALVEVDGGLVLVGLDAREQGGEVLDRVVRLQVRGLVRDEAVPDRV